MKSRCDVFIQLGNVLPLSTMNRTPIDIQLKTLPSGPGVYQYYDKNGKILYVGKAKNLKRRVSSYFQKKHDNNRIALLVKRIVEIKHIVVESETDALLLENNLIKKYQPRFNVMLKDDKTYPWLCIKNEAFPRIFLTRNVIKDGSEYYGPYPSVRTVRILLELINELFPLRRGSLSQWKKDIETGKIKNRVEYQIRSAFQTSDEWQTKAGYEANISQIREILKGNFKTSLNRFKEKMQAYASNLEFEAAQEIKEKIDALENYQAKSTVVNPKINNVDVYSIVSDEGYAYVNFLQISHGAIIRSHTIEMKKKLEETDKELLELGITEIRQRFDYNSREIYVPFKVNIGEGLKVSVPKIGDKKAIVDLSERNAKYYRQERFKQMKFVDPNRHTNRLMKQMKEDLRLSKEPRHIECFDNSNIQGTNPVAACVVFKNGKPSKKDYRKFNIKTVEGPDDFASMEEVVYRRYRRLLDEGHDLPQLIVIDGGKGQLSSALKALETLALRGKVPIIGIAERLEELYYPEDRIPLYLDKKSETLRVIQRLRDEAHRFGLSFHRNKRSKAALGTELQRIQGIGEKTAITLLKNLRSTKRIAKTSEADLARIIGPAKAKLVYNYFQKKPIEPAADKSKI